MKWLLWLTLLLPLQCFGVWTGAEFVRECGVIIDQADELANKAKTTGNIYESNKVWSSFMMPLLQCDKYISDSVHAYAEGLQSGYIMGFGILVDKFDVDEADAAAMSKERVDIAIELGYIPGFCNYRNTRQLGKVAYKYIKNHPEKEDQSALRLLVESWREAFPPPCK